jgi:hypothetical protein
MSPESRFYIDNVGYFNDGGDLRAIFPTESSYSPAYLAAILNSTAGEFFHHKTSKRKDAGKYEYFGNVLDRFPVRHIFFTTPAARRAALVEQGRQPYEAADPSGLVAFVEQRLAAQPEESDVVHDLLAFLAEQMIDLNKRKQAEQKRFLGWLEGVLKISEDRQGNTGLDALTGKTTLRNYLGDYQKGAPELPYEELEDILFKNKTRLGVSLSDTRFTARLRAEYEKSLAVLRPIKAQLARTDALIDQVVYKLYGLSEEEIKVVEGTTH